MAQDIKLLWNEQINSGDIKFENEDLIREGGLDSAVYLSLFLDRHAEDDDVLDDPNDKRGWWADQINTDGDKIGSRLWLLERSKTTQDTLNKAKEYAEESLEWMTDSGVAEKITVKAERFGTQGNDRLGLTVKIFKKDGNAETYIFDDVWNNQFGL